MNILKVFGMAVGAAAGTVIGVYAGGKVTDRIEHYLKQRKQEERSNTKGSADQTASAS